MTTLLHTAQRWECPNCPAEYRSERILPNRFHVCPGLHGLTAPMVIAGTSCEVYAVEREDYVGNERVRLDARGRPVMAVVTKRDNGEDRVVFAPTARAGVRQ